MKRFSNLFDLNQRLRRSSSEIQLIQYRLFQKQLKTISRSIPFYIEFFKKNHLNPEDFKSLEDIQWLPIINKERILEDQKLFLSAKFPKQKWKTSKTSGTTGQPFTSYFDKTTWVRKRYLTKMRARYHCGMKPGQKILIFTSRFEQTIRRQSQIFKLIYPLHQVRFFSVFESTSEAIKCIKEFRPENIYGAPNHFLLIAEEVHKRGINFDFIERLFCSAELLLPHMRKFISKMMKAPLFDIYGSSELKEIAWECKDHSGLHINQDELILEINHGGKHSVNESGGIIITDLMNKAMPLIRYQTGDRGQLREGLCTCGVALQRMSMIEGRTSDNIRTKDGEIIFYSIFPNALLRLSGILQFQLEQTKIDKIIVNVVSNLVSKKRLKEDIINCINQITHDKFSVEVDFVDHIRMEENGKILAVKNHLS